MVISSLFCKCFVRLPLWGGVAFNRFSSRAITVKALKFAYQQYHDNRVVRAIVRVRNRSRASPNLSLSSGTCSSSSGIILLLTLAIFLKIAFASSTFPLSINQRTDSGVKLTANNERNYVQKCLSITKSFYEVYEISLIMSSSYKYLY